MNPKLTLALLAIGLSVPAFAVTSADNPAAHLLGGGGKGPTGPGPSTPGGDFGVVDEWDEHEDTLLDQAIRLLEIAETAPTVKDLNQAIKDLSVAEDMEEQEIRPREAKEPKGPRGTAGPRKPTSSRPRHAKEDHEEIIKQEKNAIQLIQEAVTALQTNNRKKTTDNVSAALVAIKRADVLNEDEDPNEGTESVKGARAAASASGATAPAKPRKK